MSGSKVVTGVCRWSYLNVVTPRAAEAGQEPKYSVSLLIDKKDTATLQKVKAAIDVAKQEYATKFGGGKVPANLRQPLRDGDIDKPDDAAYAGHYFINASSKTKPGLVDADLQPIIDAEKLYSGAYGRASINFYPYSNVSKGIGAGLNNLQFVRDGEPLGGKGNAAADFADSAEEDFLA